MAVSGSDFARSLPETPTPARELAIFNAVRAGLHVPIVWSEIQVSIPNHVAALFVSDDALKIGNAADALRVNTSAQTAQWIADHLGTVLPSKRVVDLIWQHAHVRLTPCTQTPDAEMAWTHRMVRHSCEVNDKLASRRGLVANVGKDWVVSNRLSQNPGKVANYGWFRTNGIPIQPVQLGHSFHHVDYSQVVRLVRRDMVVDGRVMNIEDVARDPDLAALISDEGPMAVWRQPGIANPPAAQPSTEPGHEDPASWRTLRRGMKGLDVGAWQRVLIADGNNMSPWGDDGNFGRATHNATVSWQIARRLPGTGIVDTATKAAIGSEPQPGPAPSPSDAIAFVQARNYTPANRTRVDVVVIHTMEAPEASTTAENVAAWASAPSAPQASWHYAIDADSMSSASKKRTWRGPPHRATTMASSSNTPATPGRPPKNGTTHTRPGCFSGRRRSPRASASDGTSRFASSMPRPCDVTSAGSPPTGK